MTTIAEIRQKYPQYSDISDDQLAVALHKRFYADMPYEEFSSRIGLKPTPEPRSATGELGRQAGLFARTALNAATALPRMAMDAGVAARNVLTGEDYELPTEMWDKGLTGIGLPEYETGVEKGTGIIGEGLLSAKLVPTRLGTSKDAPELFKTAPGFIRKTAGKVYSHFSPKYRAKAIVERAVAPDRDTVLAAMRAAGDDVSAAQAAEPLKNETFSALGQIARANDEQEYFRILESMQDETRQDVLRRLARASTATEARAVGKESRKALGMVTSGRREAELGAADTAGRVLRKQQPVAERFGKAASESVEDVRRLNRATEIAKARADEFAPVPGQPRVPGRYSYADDLAKIGERGQQEAADRSLLFGSTRRGAEYQTKSLSAYGLKPLSPDGIVSSLEKRIADSIPGTATNRALRGLMVMIRKSAGPDGTISAQKLAKIRTEGINDVVERVVGGTADPKARSEQLAGILSGIKPYIDDAIETAGGTEWKAYLKDYEQGMRLADRQKVSAHAQRLYHDKNFKELIKIIGGNNPEKVKKLTGKAEDIGDVMGDQYPQLLDVADQLLRDLNLEEAGNKGRAAMMGIIRKEVKGWFLPRILQRGVVITNTVLGEVETKVGEKTLKIIHDAMKNGKGVADILELLPPEDTVKFLRALQESEKGLMRKIVIGQAIADQQEKLGQKAEANQ